jgi:hypothetical protein
MTWHAALRGDLPSLQFEQLNLAVRRDRGKALVAAMRLGMKSFTLAKNETHRELIRESLLEYMVSVSSDPSLDLPGSPANPLSLPCATLLADLGLEADNSAGPGNGDVDEEFLDEEPSGEGEEEEEEWEEEEEEDEPAPEDEPPSKKAKTGASSGGSLPKAKAGSPAKGKAKSKAKSKAQAKSKSKPDPPAKAGSPAKGQAPAKASETDKLGAIFAKLGAPI